MSDSALRIYFGIKDLLGLVSLYTSSTGYSIAKKPVLASTNYYIETTINPADTDPYSQYKFGYIDGDSSKSLYSKIYRKSVVWNFGDGTKVTGTSAKHIYTVPGKNKITASFIDIDRNITESSYCIYVVVKEVFPTKIEFDTDSLSKTISCSKREKLINVDSYVSNIFKEITDIKVTRCDADLKYKEETNYSELTSNKVSFPHLKKYYAFLEKENNYSIIDNNIIDSYYRSVDAYTPEYNEISVNVYVTKDKNGEDILDYDFVALVETGIVEDFTIKAIDPNSLLIDNTGKYSDPDTEFEIELDAEGEYYTLIDEKNENINLIAEVGFRAGETFAEYNVKAYGTKTELDALETDYYTVGKYANFDIYYKSDYTGKQSFSLVYDLDIPGFKHTLEDYSFYNLNPMGFNIEVNHTDSENIDYLLSSSALLTDNSVITNHLDKLSNAYLFKDIDIPLFLIPYIDDSETSQIYIPKDVVITNVSISSKATVKENSDLSEEFFKLYNFNFSEDSDNLVITIKYTIDEISYTKSFTISLSDIPSYNNTIIPKEKAFNQDLDELISTYTPHPMFDNTPKLKSALKSILGNENILNYILTRNNSFLNDTGYYKTCFISNLVSLLQSMGEDVSEYNYGVFDNIRELRDFVRLLSMHQSDLCGHVISDDPDITISNIGDNGINVADKLSITDGLLIDSVVKNNTKIYYIVALLKQNESGKYNIKTIDSDHITDKIVIEDFYTSKTKLVSINTIPESDFKDITIEDKSYKWIRLSNYKENWGWNLLLPADFSNPDLKNEILNRYYTFYFYNSELSSIVRGNFVSTEYLTSTLYDKDKWDDEYGVNFRALNKIINHKLNFISNHNNTEICDL